MPVLLNETASASGKDKQALTGNPIVKFFKNNGLSLAFLGLYLTCGLGQGLTGLRSFNADRLAHSLAPLPLGQFLHTGNFLDAIFVNGQAAVLQLAVLILFGSFLHQKGATHSRKEEGESGHREDSDGGQHSWLYRNSLSLAFVALFVVFFALHVIYGAAANNEQRQLERQAPIAAMAFFGSTKFWTDTLACWQAEFFALFAYVILSIFLRQKNSPESKPENSSDRETGESNK